MLENFEKVLIEILEKKLLGKNYKMYFLIIIQLTSPFLCNDHLEFFSEASKTFFFYYFELNFSASYKLVYMKFLQKNSILFYLV